MSFPQYAEYIDSGVEWLGEMPAHWLLTKTKHVVTFTTGWTPPTGDAASFDGTNLWANISDLGAKVIFDTARRISDRAVDASRIQVSPAGSLLFSFKLSIGQVSFAGVDLYTNEAIATFLPSETLSLAFAYYAFPQVLVQNAAENIYGAKLLNQDLIRSASIALPPFHEQTQIAAILDRETAKIDALVEEQKRLIELLKEKRQAVISQAITKGLDPNVPMKDSGVEWLGEVPAHWEVTPLRHIVHVRSGGTPDKTRREFWDGDVPWASAKDLKVDALADTVDHITDAALSEGAATLVDAGVVLVVVRGMILARTFPVVTAKVKMAINQDLKAVSVRDRGRNDWLAWLLRASTVESLSRLDEAGHGTKALRMDAWGDMRIAVPEATEQQRIASFLESECARIDDLVGVAEHAIGLLNERRSALISAAVTGKIDVRGLVPQSEAVPA